MASCTFGTTQVLTMTSLTQPCADFGELVQDVQECTDAGEGLEQLSSKGLAALLYVRHLGFNMFDATEKGKEDTAKARHAFDEKTLVLQNILYETGYYQKEIQEAADYKSKFSESELELMPVEHFQQYAADEFTAGLDSSSPDYDHQLTLRRLDHELHSRKQARKNLSELKARRDALQTNLGQKRKAQADLRSHIGQINASTQNVRQLFNLADATSCRQDELAQLLPLPLYFIFSQSTAVLDTLSMAARAEVVGSKEQAQSHLAAESNASSQPARKRQKRAASLAENELYQVQIQLLTSLIALSPGTSFQWLCQTSSAFAAWSQGWLQCFCISALCSKPPYYCCNVSLPLHCLLTDHIESTQQQHMLCISSKCHVMCRPFQ